MRASVCMSQPREHQLASVCEHQFASWSRQCLSLALNAQTNILEGVGVISLPHAEIAPFQPAWLITSMLPRLRIGAPDHRCWPVPQESTLAAHDYREPVIAEIQNFLCAVIFLARRRHFHSRHFRAGVVVDPGHLVSLSCLKKMASLARWHICTKGQACTRYQAWAHHQALPGWGGKRVPMHHRARHGGHRGPWAL